MGRIALAGGMTKVFDVMPWSDSFGYQMIRHFFTKKLFDCGWRTNYWPVNEKTGFRYKGS